MVRSFERPRGPSNTLSTLHGRNTDPGRLRGSFDGDWANTQKPAPGHVIQAETEPPRECRQPTWRNCQELIVRRVLSRRPLATSRGAGPAQPTPASPAPARRGFRRPSARRLTVGLRPTTTPVLLAAASWGATCAALAPSAQLAPSVRPPPKAGGKTKRHHGCHRECGPSRTSDAQ